MFTKQLETAPLVQPVATVRGGRAVATLQAEVVVITGAGRGQGLAELHEVAAEGGVPIAVDLELGDEARSVAALCREADVSDPHTWAELADSLAETRGRVHGLVDDAAIGARQRLPEVSADQWDRALAVNLTASLLAMQALVPLMTDGGSVVDVSSVAGLTGTRTTAYTVSKWGLRGLSALAANELGDRAVRVNTVFPGSIDTPPVRQNPEPAGGDQRPKASSAGPVTSTAAGPVDGVPEDARSPSGPSGRPSITARTVPRRQQPRRPCLHASPCALARGPPGHRDAARVAV
ncbi:SDR family NAD(P)-dependent oxidoreductase [Geodermatophilus sp. URMC 62]|uniref:SDR family NAD(P)-dependent oxidoreductase n=1 Tax=Geodermatophilus sp. URMC 62 TaxID=3423414 RepID=UPI00406D4A58